MLEAVRVCRDAVDKRVYVSGAGGIPQQAAAGGARRRGAVRPASDHERLVEFQLPEREAGRQGAGRGQARRPEHPQVQHVAHGRQRARAHRAQKPRRRSLGQYR